jgi:deazaflavin-dependent oxidoreductase (nitroreductase family)
MKTPTLRSPPASSHGPSLKDKINLKDRPIARVQVMGRTLTVRAEELPAEEAAAFWPHVLRVAPGYARYQQATSRTIPLVRLVPLRFERSMI